MPDTPRETYGGSDPVRGACPRCAHGDRYEHADWCVAESVQIVRRMAERAGMTPAEFADTLNALSLETISQNAAIHALRYLQADASLMADVLAARMSAAR